MAGSKANYLENKQLDHSLGGGDYTRPANVTVHLYTVAPSDAGGGTEVNTGTEWSNYAAVTVTNNATNWPAASGGLKSNGTVISFGTATIIGTTVLAGWAIKDGSTNYMYWGTFASPVTVVNGDPVRFNIGDLVIAED